MRILLLSDIHSNLEALEACLVAAPPYQIVVNLGDIVGYGACPNEVVDRARNLGVHFVRGNHDKAASGLIDLREFNPLASMAATWTRSQLNSENLSWLRALPVGPLTLPDLPDIQFVHGSPLDEDEYVINVQDAVEPLLNADAPITFFGHSHLQGAFVTDNVSAHVFRPQYESPVEADRFEFPLQPTLRYLINPGSVGQPRDGDWRAAFAVFDSETLIVTFCRVPYNLKKAQDRILAAKLPPRLANRLAAGR
ncbi:MAG: metallophosphoesterase family protein [Acidobacteriales bacterium]|nr:metallophosphoesterase family protein [Terriglobales bacterium]